MTPFRFFIRISLKYAHACTPQTSNVNKHPQQSVFQMSTNVYKYTQTSTHIPKMTRYVPSHVTQRSLECLSFHRCQQTPSNVDTLPFQHRHQVEAGTRLRFQCQQVILNVKKYDHMSTRTGVPRSKDAPPRRTLQSPYAQGPMATQGGGCSL